MSTRRLAAILFADIAGYTALMQQDEQKALAQLEKFKAQVQIQVQAQRGELIQFYGDGCLAIFQSSVKAVTCASALQEQFQEEPQVPVRIGLHVGDIMLKEGNAYGNAVNIASRVESMGVPGAVLLSGSVRDQIRNQAEFELQKLGQFAFKNVEDPMSVYALANEGLAVPELKEMAGKGTVQSKPGKPNDTKTLIRSLSIGFVGMLIALGIWMGISWTNKESEVLDKSIAVLDFRNDSGDPANDYFCNGVRDDVLFQLQKMKDLKVVTSLSRSGASIPENMAQLGEELGVAYLLTGSVRRSEKEVVITTRLVNAVDESQLWAERYQQVLSLENVFKIQGDIAEQIAASLQSQFDQTARNAASALPTQNEEAYEQYLKGRQQIKFIISANDSVFRKALKHYHKAVELDPDFAEALVEIGKCYEILYWWKLDPHDSTKAKAREYIQRALAVDPELPRARLRYAGQLYHFDRDYSGALAIMEPLRQVIPNEPELYIDLGAIYKRTGRGQEAVATSDRLVELAPFHPDWLREAAQIYAQTRHYEKAINTAKRLIRVDPVDGEGYGRLALLYMITEWNPDRGMQILNELAEPPQGYYFLARFELAMAMEDYALVDELCDATEEKIFMFDANRYLLKDHVRAWAAWGRGEHRLSRKLAAQAVETLRQELEKNPDDIRLHLALGECYALLGEEKKAQATMDATWEIMPFERDVWLGALIEQSHLKTQVVLGHYDEALDKAQLLLSIPSYLSLVQLQNHPLYAPLRELEAYERVYGD